MRDLDAEIEQRFYPGSKREIPDRRPEPKKPTEPGAWDDNPVIHNGVEYFTIGMLAMALGRAADTVRKWERQGVLPPARFRTASNNVKRGARRLYTRAQVEGIVRIAREEGLMAEAKHGGPRRDRIPGSFTGRVNALFKEIG